MDGWKCWRAISTDWCGKGEHQRHCVRNLLHPNPRLSMHGWKVRAHAIHRGRPQHVACTCFLPRRPFGTYHGGCKLNFAFEASHGGRIHAIGERRIPWRHEWLPLKLRDLPFLLSRTLPCMARDGMVWLCRSTIQKKSVDGPRRQCVVVPQKFMVPFKAVLTFAYDEGWGHNSIQGIYKRCLLSDTLFLYTHQHSK